MYSTYETGGTIIQRSHDNVRTAKYEKQKPYTYYSACVCPKVIVTIYPHDRNIPKCYLHTHTHPPTHTHTHIHTPTHTYTHTQTHTHTQTSGYIYLVMRAIEATMGFQNTSPEERPRVYAK